MLEVEEMNLEEMKHVLARVGYGHLGCARDNRPYIVPIHYAFNYPDIYIYTTEGMKTDFIKANPEVCLQVEEVHDAKNWRSVIATGKAERLTEKADIDRAMEFILETNPTLTPARNLMWIDCWGRASIEAVYRLTPHILSGRMTIAADETRGSLALDNLVITNKSRQA
jgi:uncharacterized protein